MTRSLSRIVASGLLGAGVLTGSDVPTNAPPLEPASESGPVQVVVIPVHDEISKPQLYIVRRGLKQAIDAGVNLVILDMKSPGGLVAVTLDIMEALDKFPGAKVTFVNDEAISAGAIIASITDDIYFAPKGIMGAAEVVLGTGQDVGESMQRKFNSYMAAKIEALSEGNPTRSDVLRAMMDPKFEFKMGDEVIKAEGELLTLTAAEASKEYGEPPKPLLAAGIVNDVESLIRERLGHANFTITRLEVTWSEKLAQYLTSLAPLLLAAGLVCLFIEFKTPGFGVFGVSGGLLLSVVFFGHYIAGFSGHEPIVLFGLGLLLLALEVFLFPGTVFLGAAGGLCLLASLVWAMADLWPNEPIEFSGEVFFAPLSSVGLGVLLAVLLMLVLIRFLPKEWVWNRMVLQANVSGVAQDSGGAPAAVEPEDELVGRRGVAVTALYPSGQIEIDGRRYEAQLALGLAERGTPVVVTGRSEFGLRVERDES